MSKKLLIRDLTLRDGQQSLFATRMRQEQIDRVLPFYKDANFYAMEVWGGAVPDSVMRYLNENPWNRLQSIKKEVGDVSKLTALSRGRNLFGYTPYTDEIIDGFCKNAIDSGLGIMRIFDALNDINNVKSTIKYVKQHGGIADCAVCYTIDPEYKRAARYKALLKGKPLPKPVFTDKYFVNLAKELEKLGADMVTIKDMSGLIPPMRVSNLIKAFKKAVKVPVDFHTHCTPGYGLASVLAAVVSGVDIIDTNIWNFAGGPAAPAIELIYIFTKKLGIEMDVNMEAVAKINKELYTIRQELADVDAGKHFPHPFNPLTDTVPAEIDAEFDKAIKAAQSGNEQELVRACHAIEKHFGFPKPNELVKKAQIPGGMYTNMVAQLKALKSEDILEDAMKLIPQVRLDAGLPPLVTPTSQIVGAQAVNCAMDAKKGLPMYTNVSNQFISLVKGEYGKTPIPVKPEFREKICGHSDERPFDTSKYKMQPNPVLEDFGGVKLAENEEEELLLELFPMVAKGFLTGVKKAAWEAKKASSTTAKKATTVEAPKAAEKKLSGKKVTVPMPGRIMEFLVKPGDKVEKDQPVAVLEAMKMENSITSHFAGYVNSLLAAEGETVAADAAIMDIVDESPQTVDNKTAAPAQAKKATGPTKPVTVPMPGKILDVQVSAGDGVEKGQVVVILEAMKMENSITSDFAGTVNEIFVEVGDTVAADAKVLDLIVS
ncbi:oxaloacetate decarboxylase, alpha subunit/pyruvate carboxylase subunit B [Saccharicrinis carchari]|uniref:Oxaloacetate decarboxylase, alpha subunit/pyruvate carboxylase subunit B n=1 Tax=Saccharicrinis carchari TaxID=1168039 RepID=A0A521ARQ1_SACCC|nr:biotin/lipoyl-containing protein [Saccharicrinis carchari]SMO37476.1 oxaloacetate decarboxylase, alpha subunit/pyruvate carboxylase subunit B [Saccharicrinis carchari]